MTTKATASPWPRVPGEALRYALLKTHYRRPLDLTPAALLRAKAELDTFYRALLAAERTPFDPQAPLPRAVSDVLDDDMNTPRAIAALHQIGRALMLDPLNSEAKSAMLASGDVLGILTHDPAAWFAGAVPRVSDADIRAAIDQRADARRRRDYAEADRIRGELAALGITLMDGPDGSTTWH